MATRGARAAVHPPPTRELNKPGVHSRGGGKKEMDSLLEEMKQRRRVDTERKQITKEIEQSTSGEEKLRLQKELHDRTMLLSALSQQSGLLGGRGPGAGELGLGGGLSSGGSGFDAFAAMGLTAPPGVNTGRVDLLEPTTNLFFQSLPAGCTEDKIASQFKRFGKIASVKVMYPRSEVDKTRTTLSGFVAFCTREEAERAQNAMDGTQWEGVTLRIGWGKAIPKAQVEQLLRQEDALPQAELDKLERVEVRLPRDGVLRKRIDRLAEEVKEEGHSFEQAVMEKVMGDRAAFQQRKLQEWTERWREENLKNHPPETMPAPPKFMHAFEFLFDHDSEPNRYYRWRVYSLMQGDTVREWRVEPFQIYVGGRLWVPPPCAADMERKKEAESGRKSLGEKGKDGDDDRDRGSASAAFVSSQTKRPGGGSFLTADERRGLENVIRKLNVTRKSVREGMTFCLDLLASSQSTSKPSAFVGRERADGVANEVVECLVEALTLPQTPWASKLARLYLVSDILHNSSSQHLKSGWVFRREFEKVLPSLFEHLGSCLNGYEKEAAEASVERETQNQEEGAEGNGGSGKGTGTAKQVGSASKEQPRKKLLALLGAWEPIFGQQYMKGLECSAFTAKVRNYREREKDACYDGCGYPPWLQSKLRDWEGHHFSQLEKICRSKGLPWISSRDNLEGAEPQERLRQKWLLDRLVNFELYWVGSGSGSKSNPMSPGGGNEYSEGFVNHDAWDPDLDGRPLDATVDCPSFQELDDWGWIELRIKDWNEDYQQSYGAYGAGSSRVGAPSPSDTIGTAPYHDHGHPDNYLHSRENYNATGTRNGGTYNQGGGSTSSSRGGRYDSNHGGGGSCAGDHHNGKSRGNGWQEVTGETNAQSVQDMLRNQQSLELERDLKKFDEDLDNTTAATSSDLDGAPMRDDEIMSDKWDQDSDDQSDDELKQQGSLHMNSVDHRTRREVELEVEAYREQLEASNTPHADHLVAQKRRDLIYDKMRSAGAAGSGPPGTSVQHQSGSSSSASFGGHGTSTFIAGGGTTSSTSSSAGAYGIDGVGLLLTTTASSSSSSRETKKSSAPAQLYHGSGSHIAGDRDRDRAVERSSEQDRYAAKQSRSRSRSRRRDRKRKEAETRDRSRSRARGRRRNREDDGESAGRDKKKRKK